MRTGEGAVCVVFGALASAAALAAGDFCPRFQHRESVLDCSEVRYGCYFPRLLTDGSGLKLYHALQVNSHSSLALATSEDGITWVERGVVLSPGDEWERTHIYNCAVVRVGTQYLMWYTGYPGDAIGLATSSDGMNWTKYPGNPVLRSAGGWDRIMRIGTVRWAPELNQFQLWYCGNGAPWDILRVGYATSTDGIHWLKQPSPVFTDVTTEMSSWNDVCVTKVGDTYEMYYCSSHRDVRFAASQDGTVWQVRDCDPVLAPGGTDWDRDRIWGVDLLVDSEGRRQLFYSARQDETANQWRIGVATRAELADMDCDGRVTNFDIDPFLMALSEPSRYVREYPDCDLMLADCNRDGFVDNFDIDSFVECIANGGCP